MQVNSYFESHLLFSFINIIYYCPHNNIKVFFIELLDGIINIKILIIKIINNCKPVIIWGL